LAKGSLDVRYVPSLEEPKDELQVRTAVRGAPGPRQNRIHRSGDGGPDVGEKLGLSHLSRRQQACFIGDEQCGHREFEFVAGGRGRAAEVDYPGQPQRSYRRRTVKRPPLEFVPLAATVAAFLTGDRVLPAGALAL
jgi:hypothetical protein